MNKNIFSAQGKVGNIFSLNDSEILSDNKFSLGGRWLRGFDAFGAGPRNSRTSYVGGNNILALKLDFSKPISLMNKIQFILIYLMIMELFGVIKILLHLQIKT